MKKLLILACFVALAGSASAGDFAIRVNIGGGERPYGYHALRHHDDRPYGHHRRIRHHRKAYYRPAYYRSYAPVVYAPARRAVVYRYCD